MMAKMSVLTAVLLQVQLLSLKLSSQENLFQIAKPVTYYKWFFYRQGHANVTLVDYGKNKSLGNFWMKITWKK